MKPTSDLFPSNGGLLSVQKNRMQIAVADLGADPSLCYYNLPEESKIFIQKLRCGLSV